MTIDGNPARVRGPNSLGLRRANVAPDARGTLKQAYRILYREQLAVPAAVEKIRRELPSCPEVEHLLAFIEKSERGIIR
jgi:UDP-N-acetylglucosamine acyltransferase